MWTLTLRASLLSADGGLLNKHPRARQGGESNGSPLQYSCLENPMDGGAWWAAVHGVAKSRTRLKRLSSGGGSQAGCIVLKGPFLPVSSFRNSLVLSVCLPENVTYHSQ